MLILLCLYPTPPYSTLLCSTLLYYATSPLLYSTISGVRVWLLSSYRYHGPVSIEQHSMKPKLLNPNRPSPKFKMLNVLSLLRHTVDDINPALSIIKEYTMIPIV